MEIFCSASHMVDNWTSHAESSRLSHNFQQLTQGPPYRGSHSHSSCSHRWPCSAFPEKTSSGIVGKLPLSITIFNVEPVRHSGATVPGTNPFAVTHTSNIQQTPSQFCGARPKYYDQGTGKLHPFCGKTCASKSAATVVCDVR